jgi:hypothetical protein
VAQSHYFEAWAIAFNLGSAETPHVALKSTWDIDEAKIAEDCFHIQLEDICWSQGATSGQLKGQHGQVVFSWDLTYSTEPEGFRHLPYQWMYRGSIPKSKATSPQFDTRFDGRVTLNGQTTIVADAPGMLGHNWGSQHGTFWIWAHCNAWSGPPGVAFEAVSSKVSFGPVSMPLLTVLHLRLPGERITMNGLLRALKIKSEPMDLAWRLEATDGRYQIQATFTADPKEVVGVHYYDPNGSLIHCANTKLAAGRLVVNVRKKGGWDNVLDVESHGTSALEIGDRKRDYGVPVQIT